MLAGTIAAREEPLPVPPPRMRENPRVTPQTHDEADQARHSAFDDVLAILTGTAVASAGLFLLKSGGVVTGGTAGLSLLLSYATRQSFALVFILVNTPFFALALWKKGAAFTLRTAASVLIVAGLSHVHTNAFGPLHLAPLYAAVIGNLLAAVGLLILFRHRSSLGGFNIIALLAQERLGWRAGYVQLALDAVIVLSALAVVPVSSVALSALGALILNVSLAKNHRPGRYLGY